MKCQKCGQEVSENNRFCPQCGAKLEMYFFWDIEVEFNSETMGKSKIVQGKKIVLDSEAMVEELKKAESQIISLYSSMNIEDENSIRNIREQIKAISQKYNIAFTIVEELDYRLKKIKGIFEKEKPDSGKKEESKSGIFIDGSFENLKNMVEKNDKRHSMESVLIFLASLIILFFEGKAWIRELMSSFGNKWAFMWAVYDVVMYIFFDALIAYVVWRISERFIYKNKQKISEMCLNMLVINDVQALYTIQMIHWAIGMLLLPNKCKKFIVAGNASNSGKSILFGQFLDSLFDANRIMSKDRLFQNTTKAYWEHEIQRGIDLSGVKKIRLHDLRHSHASLLISKLGAQPNLVADRLGHEKVQTTLSTYSHLYPDQSRELANQLEKLVETDEN